MKKIITGFLALIVLLITSCYSQSNMPSNTVNIKDKTSIKESTTDATKRVNLYLSAMRAAFQEGNGGNDFIAIKIETLEGLSEIEKIEVLEGLKDLSPNIYKFEEVRNDISKFTYDENGNLRNAIDGTLLSIKLEKYEENFAIIEATSWFGNLGASIPKYNATYKNGKWHLELISIGEA